MLSVEDLYVLAGVIPTGATRWGDDVPSKQPGVYVISIEDDLTGLNLPERERAFWIPDQKIIYIGRAKQLKRRLRQFRRHVYDRPSPHRGGQAILLLDCTKTIMWAEVPDYGKAEAALIDAFHAKIGRKPFGNRVRSAVMSPTA
jgi:GIY-YIG catalytic domain